MLSGMLPIYLTEYLKLGTQEAGFVASAVGFGGFFGQFAWPGISDFLGRKTTATLGFLGAAIMLYIFQQTGAHSGLLFAFLFVGAFFTLGLVALLTGPIATESAPVGLVSAAIGIVVGSGEISAGIAQVIGGWVAQNFGIQNILFLPLGAVLLGIVVSLVPERDGAQESRRRIAETGGSGGLEEPAARAIASKSAVPKDGWNVVS